MSGASTAFASRALEIAMRAKGGEVGMREAVVFMGKWAEFEEAEPNRAASVAWGVRRFIQRLPENQPSAGEALHSSLLDLLPAPPRPAGDWRERADVNG